MKEQGWICPSAPVRKDRPQQPWGCVDQAWIITRFEVFPELFWGVPTNRPVPPTTRATSYGLNMYVFKTDRHFAQLRYDNNHYNEYYRFESRVEHPSRTPIIQDAVTWYWIPAPLFSSTLGVPPTWVYGVRPDRGEVEDGLSYFTVARHGSRPSPLPEHWTPHQRLPGAVNVSFLDGHVKQVKLEGLWQLYWHRGYEPPPKRPGLK